jgi:hypothetical protein
VKLHQTTGVWQFHSSGAVIFLFDYDKQFDHRPESI